MPAFRRFIGKTGPFIIIFLSILPAFLWLPTASFVNSSATFRSLGQVFALIGTAILCINVILASRLKVLEHLFFGLNRAYIYHHIAGAFSFILLLFHPVFLILGNLSISLESAALLVTPSTTNIPVVIGEIALLFMIVLLVLTFYIRLEYDVWKKTHTWLGVPLLLASFHSLTVGSTLIEKPPLRVYMVSLFIVSIIAFFWRIILKHVKIGRYHYSVSSVERRDETIIVSMNALGRKMNYMPGQFAFLVPYHRGILKESHPFSIMSDPKSNTLKFAVKSVGDFTESLKLLSPRSDVLVEGPYGRFSWEIYPGTSQVWIGSGIGITPFVGMLTSFDSKNHCDVTVYYCVRDEEEAIFNQELKQISENIPNVIYIQWSSSKNGRLTAEQIVLQVSDLLTREIFICGSPQMMESLTRQLIKTGVKSGRIHTEEFSLQ